MVHPIGNEENMANHGRFQKMRRSSPAAVLTHSRSHVSLLPPISFLYFYLCICITLYMYMYYFVCICLFIYVCICIFIYVCMCLFIYIYLRQMLHLFSFWQNLQTTSTLQKSRVKSCRPGYVSSFPLRNFAFICIYVCLFPYVCLDVYMSIHSVSAENEFFCLFTLIGFSCQF